MKRTSGVPAVTRHWPEALALPPRFDALVRAARGGAFALGWRDARKLHRSEVMEQLAVFMTLPDGGVVALWSSGDTSPVVHVDSEGGARVIARDFDDFLARLSRRTTRVPDLDAREEGRKPLSFGIRLPAPRPFAASTKAFARALALGTPALDAGDDADSVRSALVRLGAAIVRDKLLRRDLTRMMSPRDAWSVHLRVSRGPSEARFEYANAGTLHALPERYGMVELWPRLRALCKRPNAPSFSIQIDKGGLVSVDRDEQFVALPGGMTLAAYLAKLFPR